MPRFALMLSLFLLLSLSGCDRMRNRQATPSPLLTAGQTSEASTSKAQTDEVALHLKLVEEMLDKQLYHAALAHLQALEIRQKLTPGALLLRADALRRLGRMEEATKVYKGLLDTPAAGYAYHGLGLIDANGGSMKDAVKNFRTAVSLRPVDARLRNDLGYALLLSGDVGEANFQLTTAQELGGDESRTRLNLLLLMFMEGDEESAQRFAKQHRIDPEAVARMRARALVLTPTKAEATATPDDATTAKKVDLQSVLKALAEGLKGKPAADAPAGAAGSKSSGDKPSDSDVVPSNTIPQGG